MKQNKRDKRNRNDLDKLIMYLSGAVLLVLILAALYGLQKLMFLGIH
jgi:hypothetical protein